MICAEVVNFLPTILLTHIGLGKHSRADYVGSPGPTTWGAVHLTVVGKKAPDEIKKAEIATLSGEGKTADSRSEGNIATLHPRVRPFARALIEKAAGHDIIIKVTSGTRSFAEQDKLFAQTPEGNERPRWLLQPQFRHRH